MHEEGSSQLSVKDMVKRIGILIAVSAGAGILGAKTVFEVHQATAVAVFLAIIPWIVANSIEIYPYR